MAETTKGKKGGFFSGLFTETEGSTAGQGSQEEVMQGPIAQVPDVDLSASVDQIIATALAPMEGKTATVEYLKGLVDSMPLGTPKEFIQKMLTFNGVSEDDIRADANERVALLNSTLANLESHQQVKTGELDGQIEGLRAQIDQKEEEKRSISELTIAVRQKVAQISGNIKTTMTNIE